MRRTFHEFCLVLILRTAGIVCVLALVPLLMPRAGIVTTHELLGLGAFPEQPIAEYLARATSGLYAIFGGLLLLFATAPRRYAGAIAYQSVTILGLSLCGVWFGTAAGLPLLWLGLDAAACALYCLPTLWLLSRLPREET
jgi:hypothetical protein